MPELDPVGWEARMSARNRKRHEATPGEPITEDWPGADGKSASPGEGGWERVTGTWGQAADWGTPTTPGETYRVNLAADPPPGNPTIRILADDHTPILTLRVEGGRLHAEYDPDRLDDAARALAQRMLGLYGDQAGPGG